VQQELKDLKVKDTLSGKEDQLKSAIEGGASGKKKRLREKK